METQKSILSLIGKTIKSICVDADDKELIIIECEDGTKFVIDGKYNILDENFIPFHDL